MDCRDSIVRAGLIGSRAEMSRAYVARRWSGRLDLPGCSIQSRSLLRCRLAIAQPKRPHFRVRLARLGIANVARPTIDQVGLEL
jgi:hypothetical protein